MAIIINTNDCFEILEPAKFDNEKELELAIAENPALIMTDDDLAWELVSRQVPAGDAGTMDILFVASNGKPVVVEVKRLENPESNDKVLAQAIRYSAALSKMRVNDLNTRTDGRLKTALAALSSTDKASSDHCWEECDKYLHGQQLTTVIVLDNAPKENLEGMVGYLKKLDVRLVSVSKYRSTSGMVVLVPRVWVKGEEIQPTPRDKRLPKPQLVPLIPQVQKVVNAFRDVHDMNITKTKEHDYYAYFVPKEWANWPNNNVHYEIGFEKGEFYVDIHVEKVKPELAPPIVDLLKSLSSNLSQKLGTGWEKKFKKGRGCLSIKYSKDTPPKTIAIGLKQLVENTSSQIGELLKKLEPEAIC